MMELSSCEPIMFKWYAILLLAGTLDVPAPGNYESGHNFANNSSAKPSIGLPLPKRPSMYKYSNIMSMYTIVHSS